MLIDSQPTHSQHSISVVIDTRQWVDSQPRVNRLMYGLLLGGMSAKIISWLWTKMLIKCRSSINRGVDQSSRGSMESQMRLLIGVLIEGRWRVDQGYQLKAAIDTAELCLLIVHMILIALGMSIVNNNLYVYVPCINCCYSYCKIQTIFIWQIFYYNCAVHTETISYPWY